MLAKEENKGNIEKPDRSDAEPENK